MSFGFGFALPAYPLRGGGGNNPFNQLGPTLDLSFVDGATNVGDLSNPNGYTLNTNFITPQYQVAAQYVVWETGVGLVDKTFSQIVTFSRTSGATWFNSAGVNVGIDFSTSSVAIGTGSKTFTLDATAGVDRSWTAGDIVRISEQATPANFMDGTVTSYTASTQTLVVNVTATGGSGTIASWRVSNWMPRFDYNPATLAAQGLLIEEARTNLLTYSDQFDNLAWLKAAATVTANATASPDGTVNADKLIATAVSANHYLSSGTVTISAGASVTASVYVKAAEYNTIRIAAYNSAITSGFRVDANLSTVTGTTGTLGTGSATSSSVTNVGGGWYRVTVSGIIDASSTGIVMWVQMLAAGVSPFLGDGTSGIFVFGAQLNPTPVLGGVTESLSTYYPTTASAYYGPRLDYDPVTLAAQGLLIEEQRTNLLLQSEAFNTTWTTSNASITANSTTAPSATTTADTLVEDTATNFHYVQQTVSGTTNTNNYTLSCFIKASTRTAARIAIIEGTTFSRQVRATVDLSAGTVVGSALNSATLTAATIQAVGNSWYRVTVAGVLGGTDTNILCAVYVGQDTATFNYTGNGTGSVFVFGAQLEAGAFPTSYIPTTTTALTRSADVASVNTLSPWFNATAGTLYTETVVARQIALGGTGFFVFDDGTANNAIRNFGRATGATGFNVEVAGVNVVGLSPTGVLAAGTIAKIASAYALNDFATSGNGGAAQIDTSGNVPTVNMARLGFDLSASTYLNGWIRRITYYPVRLTDATLQQITI